MTKGLKLKHRKFSGLISTFRELRWKNLVGEDLFTPMLNRFERCKALYKTLPTERIFKRN